MAVRGKTEESLINHDGAATQIEISRQICREIKANLSGGGSSRTIEMIIAE